MSEMVVPMFKNAIVRTPGPNCANGLTTADSGEPNYELLLFQHQAYIDALSALGLRIDILEPLPDFPDAYFVEDVAVVTDEIAVISRPGAPSRVGETNYIVHALEKYRPLAWIHSPGTLDGGDVMMVEKRCFIGISERTNIDGASQLGEILGKFGIKWTPVPISAGLHLKSDVNYIGNNTLLLTENMAIMDVFTNFDRIIVNPKEAYAANTLLVNDHLLTPKGCPQTTNSLRDKGFTLIELDTSEIKKMDGGLSCMSLRF